MRFRHPGSWALPVVAVLAIAAISCTGASIARDSGGRDAGREAGPTTGGTLTYALPGEPQSCDLHMTGGMAYQAVHPCNTMLSQLVRFSPADHGVIEPDLAVEWSASPDGRTWTFQLRRGVTWHDGEPFEADDVVFSLERILEPPRGLAVGRAAPFAEYVASSSGIKAAGTSTVTVTTEFPAASFMQNVASVYMSIYPLHVVERIEPPSMARFEDVIGTGPFRSAAYTPGLLFEVTRNDAYYLEGRPYLDGVRFRVMPDPAVRIAALRAGQLDVIPVITEAEERAVEGEPGIAVNRAPSGGGNTLQLNVRRPPFDDPDVRMAVNLAISREEADLALGAGYPGAVLPPGGKWAMAPEQVLRLPGYGDVEANRAEARRLLASAGYPDGFDLEIQTRSSFFFELLSDFAAGQLAEIGIKARVVPVEAATYQERISRGEFVAIGHSHSYPLDDPDAILAANYGCGGAENYPGYCDAELDELIERQSRELDEDARRHLLGEIERSAWNANAKIWLQWSSRRTAINSRVHGLEPGGPSLYQGMRLDTVWLE